jgi:Flp pilus assembly protein TadD
MTHRLLATFLMLFLLPGLRTLQAQSEERDARGEELYGQAKAAQSHNDIAAAIAKYEEILHIAPQMAPAYNNLGALYFRRLRELPLLESTDAFGATAARE